jgi:hypothetical protein
VPFRMYPLNHAAEGWARLIIGVLQSPCDVRTVTAWARTVGHSATSLRLRCQAAHTSAKASLALARLLRAYMLRELYGGEILEFVDVRDPRTLARHHRMWSVRGTDTRVSCDDVLRGARSCLPESCLNPVSQYVAGVLKSRIWGEEARRR